MKPRGTTAANPCDSAAKASSTTTATARPAPTNRRSATNR